MNGTQLKNSILQWAIQGKLVPQNPKDEPASFLLDKIWKEKRKLAEKGKIKKKDLVHDPIADDDIPFELPANWEWCRLEDIVWHLSDGTHKTPKYTDSGIPFVSVKNMSSGRLSFTNTKFVSKEESDILNQRCDPEKGDLLLSKVGTTGIPVIVDVDFQFSLFVSLALIKFFPNLIDSSFFVYLIYSPLVQAQVKEHTRGVGNKNWVLNDIAKTILAIPPLAEQKRIVAKLEQVLPLAEEYGAAQEQLDKLNKELPEALKKSILQEAIQGKLVPQNPKDESASVLLAKIRKEKEALVKQGKLKKKDLETSPIDEEEIPFEIPTGWIWARFEDLSLDSADGPFGSNLKKEHYTDKKEVRIIQLSNIGEDGWRDLNTKYTSFEHLKNISRSEAFPGDIIVAKMMPAGRAIICPDVDKKYVLSSDAVRFDFSNLLYKKYLYWAINSTVVKDQVYSEVQGITRVRTSLSKLRTYLIPIPPLAEQKRIVTKLEQLFKVL